MNTDHLEVQRVHVLTPLQFLGRYLPSTHVALSHRSKAVMAVESALKEEHQKKKALDAARSSRGVTELALAKCGDALSLAEVGVIRARKEERRVTESIRDDVEVVGQVIENQLKQQLLRLVHSQVASFRASAQSWEDTKRVLERDLFGNEAVLASSGAGAGCDAHSPSGSISDVMASKFL
jgi:hypothetical protein